MRFNHHSPSHWIAVALIAGLALFTFSHAWGQSGAAAVFEGRPAMAGAQGGMGAQGGLPQGGIGVQGTDAAQRGLNLRKPAGLDNAAGPSAARDPVAAANTDISLVPRGDSEARARDKDPGVSRNVRSDSSKAKRAAKRTVQRSRTGVGEIDSAK
jgi:hypothetical protein